MAMNTRGIKSLAGLTAYPQLIPKHIPSVMMIKPINTGNDPELGGLFRLSVKANMVLTSSIVPIN